MILPKDRDPRFITIRRGGTLTDSDHRLLALWAAACAEHVLHLFELVQPSDPRPRQAIEQTRAWVRGEIKMSQARAAAGHAQAAARELSGAARHAAYAAGQAAAVAHVAAHELGAAAYAIKAARAAASKERGGERRPARVPLAARTAAGGDSRTRPGRPAAQKRDLLVGVRLLTGVTACLHCPTSASTRRRERVTLSLELIARGSSKTRQVPQDSCALRELHHHLLILKPDPAQSTLRRVTRFVLQTTL